MFKVILKVSNYKGMYHVPKKTPKFSNDGVRHDKVTWLVVL